MSKLRMLSAQYWAVAVAAVTAAYFGLAGLASATPVYSLSGVDTTVGSEISGNLSIILTIFGSILALCVALKLVRRFSH